MDINDQYLKGIGDLLKVIETTDPDYLMVLVLQGRLARAIAEIRQFGPGDDTRVEIARVITELDRLCLARLGKSFQSLCGITELSHIDHIAQLEEWYTEGIQAMNERRWVDAIVIFQRIVDTKPDYRDVSDRLRHVTFKGRIESAQEVFSPGPVFTPEMGPDDGRRAWVRIGTALAHFLQNLQWEPGEERAGGGVVAWHVVVPDCERKITFRLREGINRQQIEKPLLRGEFWPNKGRQPRGVNLMLPEFRMGKKPQSKQVWLLALSEWGLEFQGPIKELDG